MLSNYPDLLTVNELATILRIGRNAAYNMVRSKSIKYLWVCGKYRIPKVALVDYINAKGEC